MPWRMPRPGASAEGAVTPHLLSFVARASGGRTLRVNIGLIVNNARTAARIASHLT